MSLPPWTAGVGRALRISSSQPLLLCFSSAAAPLAPPLVDGLSVDARRRRCSKASGWLATSRATDAGRPRAFPAPSEDTRGSAPAAPTPRRRGALKAGPAVAAAASDLDRGSGVVESLRPLIPPKGPPLRARGSSASFRTARGDFGSTCRGESVATPTVPSAALPPVLLLRHCSGCVVRGSWTGGPPLENENSLRPASVSTDFVRLTRAGLCGDDGGSAAAIERREDLTALAPLAAPCGPGASDVSIRRAGIFPSRGVRLASRPAAAAAALPAIPRGLIRTLSPPAGTATGTPESDTPARLRRSGPPSQELSASSLAPQAAGKQQDSRRSSMMTRT